MKAEKPLASSFSTSTMLVDVWSSNFTVKCIAGRSSNILTLPDSRRRWIPTTRTSIACVAVANPQLSTRVPPRIPAPHIGAVPIGAADLLCLFLIIALIAFGVLCYRKGWDGREDTQDSVSFDESAAFQFAWESHGRSGWCFAFSGFLLLNTQNRSVQGQGQRGEKKEVN